MNNSIDDRFAAFVGIDWADAKHDICLLSADANVPESAVITHSPEAIEEWALGLQRRFHGQPVAVCLELNKGPLVNALCKYDFFVLFPINPQSLARYRTVFSSSGAKDDPTDARLQLDLLCKHRDRLKPLEPQSAAMRELQQLVEYRRRLVGDKVRITNRLTSSLKNYFPQVLQWFSDKDTAIFCNFLSRWPTLQTAQRARRATLERFFSQHHVRYPDIIRERITEIRKAMPMTVDSGVIAPNALMVDALVGQLRATLDAIRHFDARIVELARQHSDFAFFDALPGAGPVYAPRLLAAFGEQRHRYPKPDDLQQYAGIAPVTDRSGNKTWVHWRMSCPKFLRQTFVEWAGQSIRQSFWASAFYEQQRAKGKSHQMAVRALAFKWIRILHRCWQDGTTYNESTYLKSLKKRGSPLLKNLSITAT
jgi:transposase